MNNDLDRPGETLFPTPTRDIYHGFRTMRILLEESIELLDEADEDEEHSQDYQLGTRDTMTWLLTCIDELEHHEYTREESEDET